MPPRPRLRAAVVTGVLVAGVFVMHGPSHHGDRAPTSSVDHAAMSMPGPAAAAPEGPPDGDVAVLAICLSILLGTTLVWLWTTRSRGGVRHLRRAAAVAAETLPIRRAHAPPDRWVLSVCRC